MSTKQPTSSKTAERRRRVMELTAQGLSLQAIADELHISTALVGQDRHRSPHPELPDRRTTAIALRRLNIPRAAIAGVLGVSVRTMSRYTRSAP